MRAIERLVGRLLVGGVSLTMAATAVRAHEVETALTAHSLGFETVLVLTVALGVLGGVVALRWPRFGHLPVSGTALLVVVFGCWAGVLAAMQGPAVAAVGLTVGAVATWTLRNHFAGDHHTCGQAALGAVMTHRLVEGVALATLYATDVVLGVGAALVVAGHAAAESGVVVGLWSRSRLRWLILVFVQIGFLVGVLGGVLFVDPLGPLGHTLTLALLGGALIAAGVVTESRRRRVLVT